MNPDQQKAAFDARIRAGNDTFAAHNLEVSLEQTIGRAAAAAGSAIALESEGEVLTYAALHLRTQQIAEFLLRHGLGPRCRVGVCMRRTIDLVPTLLAIWRSGAAYVPLDPDFPAARLAFMAADAELDAIVTQREVRSQTPPAAQIFFVEDICSPVSHLHFESIDPEHPAYILYTSGSTGQPKGVVVPHRALTNFAASMQRVPGLSPDDRVLAVTTLSFDIAVLELLVPLAAGARIFLARREDAMNGARLAQLIHDHAITVMQATPTTWHLLLDAGWRAPNGFRALCGGEPLPQQLARRLLAQGVELWNLYGPTETTVWSTLARVHDPEHIRIGKPIDNTQVYVLNEHQQPCAVGETGEIYIGGVGVAVGYWKRPELTAGRFLPDPYSRVPGARMYRTGDLGRWSADGTLEHFGRIDHQVKIRGYRIELGEIETQLTRVPGIARALVVARTGGAGSAELVAYVIPERNCPVDTATLRSALIAQLPDYMVPNHFVALDAFPLLPNGKIDRNALPAPAAVRISPSKLDTPTEQCLGGIWQNLLNVPRIDGHDNFFRIGGHSLLAMRMLAAVERELGVNVALSTLLDHPTCTALAAHIDSDLQRRASAWEPLVKIKDGRVRPPLFCIHAVGGNVLNYRVLADALPADQPVYGLQAIGLDGLTEPLHSVEQMAARYIEEIRRVQPSGPYYLCGGSMGGTIAFEMARQLEASGEYVALLALLDTWGPGLRRMRSAAQRSVLRKAANALVAGRIFKRLRARLDAQRQARAVRHYRARGIALPHEVRCKYVTGANEAALNRYREQSYGGDVVLLCALATQARGLADLGWSDVVRGAVTVIPLAGEHKTFVEEPEVAKALRAALFDAQVAWTVWSVERVG